MRRFRVVTPLAFVAALAAGRAEAQFPLPDPIPVPIEKDGRPVRLETIVTGMTAPNWGTFAPGGDDNRLFVVDQTGILWAIDLFSATKSVFHDVSSRLVSLGAFGPGSFDERGFLGVAFHPDYVENGLLYTYTSQPVAGPADYSTIPPGSAPNHQSVITEWRVPSPTDPTAVVDPASARELLRVDEPQFNHNAGALNFGPEGLLYIAFGDGGRGDDEGTGHAADGNGQDLSTPLGKILRIDPQGSNSANGRYGIPPDNPFAGNTKGYREEIFAYGFRNPWRFSFDSTGRLWVGDVGQDDWEEIDWVVSGGNYGWNIMEGNHCYEPPFGCDTSGLIPPIWEHPHLFNDAGGFAVIGGHVYEGPGCAMLTGKYVYGDYISRNIWALSFDDTGATGISTVVPSTGIFMTAFGVDHHGELYGTAYVGGYLFKLTCCEGDANDDGTVDPLDAGYLLARLGCAVGQGDRDCDAADQNGDGAVDPLDVGYVLARFGACK